MAVKPNDNEDTYDYVCPQDDCDFESTRWPLKKDAVARGKQHEAEHEDGTPMPELNAQEG